MKQKNVVTLVLVAFITALFTLVLSSLVFKVPLTRNVKVPTAESITTTFPDIHNDPSYNTIFNDQAKDPAQPLQVGQTNNTTPFNGSP
jgi:hypothetical protein